MNYIFLAAGKSSRIYKKINKPKSLISLNNQTLIESLLLKLKKKDRAYIITGFQKEKIKKLFIKKSNIKYIYNKYYNSKDMLYSIYLSLKKVNGDVTISYTDISYEKKIFNCLNKYKNNICIPVLKNWRKVWDIRKKNIFDDAENLEINIKDKCILSIGDYIKRKQIPRYQFMGLVKIPNFYRKLLLKNFSNIFLKNKMQTTAFLNYLINRGILIKYIPYNGKWFEFDDYNDFKIFKKKNKKFYN
jgi:choline kinase